MSDQTVFGGTSTAPNPDKGVVSTAGVIDNNSPVAVLVGEGRKYKTVEDLAKAYLEADGFIEKLKDENRVYKEEAVKAKTIDDVLDQLRAKETPSSTTTSEVKAMPSATDIAAIVEAQITGRETARERQNNLLKADAKMKELFGEKAQEVFNSKATSDATRKALQNLAEVAPDQFVALFTKGVDATAATPGTINTAALGISTAGDRKSNPGTKEYYTELRRKNPQVYYSTATQLEMNKAAQVNPQLFFGHDLDRSLGGSY